MPDALEVLENLEQLDLDEIASDAFREHSGKVVLLNREQLLEGKLSTGEDLSPTYFNDPYFKTPEAAKRYSEWKDKITPNSKRKKGVPNLFIIGTYHQSIELEVFKDEYEMSSNFKSAASIENKYGLEIYGLNDDKKEELFDDGLEDTLFEKINEKTGL